MSEIPFDPAPLLDSCVSLGRTAAHRGDSPAGAVAVSPSGELVAQASNRQWSTGDITAHAERLLLTAVASLRTRAETLWVVSNVEPCSMCASALVKARVAGIVFGAPAEDSMDPWIPLSKVLSASTHRPVVVGPVAAGRYASLLREGRRTAEEVREGRWAGLHDAL